MVKNRFISTIGTLFRDMDQLVNTKTMVGELVQVGDIIIIPLIDVTCGMAAGSSIKGVKQKHRGDRDMSAKISPSAILVIQGDVTKLVNVRNQDTITKVIDMAPDPIDKFLRGRPAVFEETVRTVKDTMVVYDTGKAEYMDVKQESRATFLHTMEYSLLQSRGGN